MGVVHDVVGEFRVHDFDSPSVLIVNRGGVIVVGDMTVLRDEVGAIVEEVEIAIPLAIAAAAKVEVIDGVGIVAGSCSGCIEAPWIRGRVGGGCGRLLISHGETEWICDVCVCFGICNR